MLRVSIPGRAINEDVIKENQYKASQIKIVGILVLIVGIANVHLLIKIVSMR